MTIASEITRIKTNIENAYTALENKGATLPDVKNSANLADTISNMSVSDSSSSEVYTLREVADDGTIQYVTDSFTFSLPSNVTAIADYCFCGALYGCTGLTAVDLNNITSIGYYSMYQAFYNCTSLTSVDLSNLTYVDGYGLRNSFTGCTNLTSVNFSSLQTVGTSSLYYAFSGCTSLTELSFPSFTSSSGNTTSLNGMLTSVENCTVHFPSNLESTVGSWASTTAGFGGTNTTVLFDLAATS